MTRRIDSETGTAADQDHGGTPHSLPTGEAKRQLPVATALITGGSRGLGHALAFALARRGTALVLVARDPGALGDTVRELRARGHRAHAIAADVAAMDQAPIIAAQAAALVGPIDLLVNNASTLGTVPLRLLLDTDCEELTRTLEVNVVAPFRLAKIIAGAQLLRGERATRAEGQGGIILNVTSDAALEPYPRWGGYGASKAALEHLTRIWATELADTGVRLFTIDPGEMDTQMHAAAMPEADRSTLADPARVAAGIVAFLEQRVLPPSGTRVAIAPGAGADR